MGMSGVVYLFYVVMDIIVFEVMLGLVCDFGVINFG